MYLRNLFYKNFWLFPSGCKFEAIKLHCWVITAKRTFHFLTILFRKKKLSLKLKVFFFLFFTLSNPNKLTSWLFVFLSASLSILLGQSVESLDYTVNASAVQS